MASSLGEEVIFCKLIRDNILSHFNPARASDLEYVLELRCYKGLLSDEDLRSCFERLWAHGTGYILQEWDSMSADEIRAEIVTHVKGKDSVGLPHTCVGVPVGFESMTKDDLKRYFGALRYVPLSIWLSRFRGLRVLEELSGRVPSHILYRHSFKGWRNSYALAAVDAGMDVQTVERVIAEEFGELDLIRKRQLFMVAESGGHKHLTEYFRR